MSFLDGDFFFFEEEEELCNIIFILGLWSYFVKIK